VRDVAGKHAPQQDVGVSPVDSEDEDGSDEDLRRPEEANY